MRARRGEGGFGGFPFSFLGFWSEKAETRACLNKSRKRGEAVKISERVGIMAK